MTLGDIASAVTGNGKNGDGGFRIPYRALTVILALVVQFVWLVVWAQNEHNSPAYTEIAAIPSATVTLKSGDTVLAEAPWDELQRQGARDLLLFRDSSIFR